MFLVSETMVYYYFFLTAIELTAGGSSRVHIYTQTVHRELNIHNNKKWEVRAVPRLCKLYSGICLLTRKTAVSVVEKGRDIPVAVVQYTFTHKQYTEQHNETEYTEWNIHNNMNA
jgi:hypothetical protein